ncbi:hypothetical protein [Streptacidiphilus sp. MAP5-52]|uniref:hypothetical protein n=1 Tax=Streptacidiphilus sp. MAP5-52 TaxID=3156267 RepID=UPI0035152707
MAPALPLKVYLDLNHWYALGDALAGVPLRPEHVTVLQQLRGHVERGEVMFPLSAVHYMELTENPRDAHRERAAEAMTLLSQFVTMAPAHKILEEEMALELHRLFARPAFPVKVEKFGSGVGFAFGEPKAMVIKGLTDENRKEFESRVGMSVSALEAKATATAEYWILRGPTAAMQATIPNYDRNAARQIADKQLASFNVMVNSLRTIPDLAQRPMEAICARYYQFDILDNYTRAIMAAGFTQDRLPFHSKEELTNFLMALPSCRVITQMQFHYLKDVHRDWTINDLRDLDALSIAIPYCDIVVTDKKARDAAVNRARLDREFDTLIFSSLKDLADHLAKA